MVNKCLLSPEIELNLTIDRIPENNLSKCEKKSLKKLSLYLMSLTSNCGGLFYVKR